MELSMLSCLHPADIYDKFEPGSDLFSRWKLCCFSDLDLVEGPDLLWALTFLFALSLERFHYSPVKAGLCTGRTCTTRCSMTHFVVKIFINATVFKAFQTDNEWLPYVNRYKTISVTLPLPKRQSWALFSFYSESFNTTLFCVNRRQHKTH